MKLMDWLHKLGILRGGVVKGTYTSYKNRPDEMMFDGVYDKKRDMVTKEDIKKVKERLAK